MNLTELGNRIRSQREKCGLKQIDLANALLVSPQAVSKWERGENAPDIAALLPLSKVLNASIEWLLGAYAERQRVFEATVLVSGVQNTRQQAESMEPAELAAWTNGICYQVTEAVLAHNGIPVRYIGPGIVSFFSGPKHAQRAVAAATAAKRTSAASLKIGISTGSIYFGPVGHPDYTQPDIIGEPFVIAFLSRDWAVSHTTSGAVACSRAAEGLGADVSLGSLQPARFDGIRHEVLLCEVKC